MKGAMPRYDAQRRWHFRWSTSCIRSPQPTEHFMPSVSTATRPDIVVAEVSSPAYQAYQVLHVAFVVAPLVAGLDKFTDWLTDWDAYLAPTISQMLPMSNHAFMMIVGGIEIFASLIVALKPRVGSLVVAGWLVGIIANLFLAHDHYDVALRDFGLFLGAIALSRLSIDFTRANREANLSD
jgi:hypothetical protein